MTSGIDPRRAAVRANDGRHSLGICRALKLLRAARLMLSSVGAVEGLSRCFDGDVRMVRAAVVQLEEWAKQEGIKL